jgi:hypothetical protein
MSGQPGSERHKNANRENALTYDQRLNHPRRCHARRQRDGEPCGRFAIKGGVVCGLHGGNTRHVQRKAKERLEFAKAIMLERAVRGMAPGADVPAAEKRLAKAVAKRAGNPLPRLRRTATRPAGPPTPPEPPPQPTQPAAPPPEAAVPPPGRPGAVRTAPERPRPRIPPFAEPTKPPSTGLTSLEDALDGVGQANRRAYSSRGRLRRR